TGPRIPQGRAVSRLPVREVPEPATPAAEVRSGSRMQQEASDRAHSDSVSAAPAPRHDGRGAARRPAARTVQHLCNGMNAAAVANRTFNDSFPNPANNGFSPTVPKTFQAPAEPRFAPKATIPAATTATTETSGGMYREDTCRPTVATTVSSSGPSYRRARSIRRWKASMVFSIRIVIVMGPTPPGTF